jgi:hypothetical protein
MAPRLWQTLGYSLFIWVALCLITVWSVTPDMLLAAFVFASAGLFLRGQRSAWPRRSAALLGAVLGAGYLTKAALFPLGLLLIAFAAAIWSTSLRPLRRIAWLVIPFVVVAAPLVVTLSARAGHFTFGDVGSFTYMKHVNGLQYPYWAESISRVGGVPAHPPALIATQPDVYTFPTPIKGTYPLAFDPAFWTEGLEPRITLDDQIRALAANAAFYWNLFGRMQGGFVAVVLMLGAIATWSRRRMSGYSTSALLAGWSVCAFGLYALVYAEPRYVGAFLLVLWGSVLGVLRFSSDAAHRRMVVAGAAVLVACVWVNIVAFNMEGAAGVLGLPSAGTATGGAARFTDGGDADHPQIAEELSRQGVRRGERVAFIGDSFGAYWARLGRLRIVADVPPHQTTTFWTAPQQRRDVVLNAFAAAGAVAVIAQRPGVDVPSPWQTLGDTGYVVRFLGTREDPPK